MKDTGRILRTTLAKDRVVDEDLDVFIVIVEGRETEVECLGDTRLVADFECGDGFRLQRGLQRRDLVRYHRCPGGRVAHELLGMPSCRIIAGMNAAIVDEAALEAL